jgi:hypothetical protein
MLATGKTDQAYMLLLNYARTPEQEIAVKTLYVDILAEQNNEDRVIIYLLGLITDGLRYGNWFWNMPPNAREITPDTPERIKDIANKRSRNMLCAVCAAITRSRSGTVRNAAPD